MGTGDVARITRGDAEADGAVALGEELEVGPEVVGDLRAAARI